jgi:hypothetical protein
MIKRYTFLEFLIIKNLIWLEFMKVNYNTEYFL